MKCVLAIAMSCWCLASAGTAAQEGHPLKGSWLGTWAGNSTHGADCLSC